MLYILYLSSFNNLEDHLLIKTNNKIWPNGLWFCALEEASSSFGWSRHACWRDCFVRQLGVTSSAHFASLAPHGNRSRVAPEAAAAATARSPAQRSAPTGSGGFFSCFACPALFTGVFFLFFLGRGFKKTLARHLWIGLLGARHGLR